MFITIHKKSIIAALIIGSVIAAVIFWHYHKSPKEEAAEVFAVPTTNKVVVIDAGHGGYALTRYTCETA